MKIAKQYSFLRYNFVNQIVLMSVTSWRVPSKTKKDKRKIANKRQQLFIITCFNEYYTDFKHAMNVPAEADTP